MLQKCCDAWLRSQRHSSHTDNYFPGKWTHALKKSKFSKSSEAKNVVLFGDFLKSLANSRSWQGESFRLWTLSHSVKKVCTDLIGIPEETIGVIPRLELFPARRPFRIFPKNKSEWVLVYAGRFSFAKNLTMLARVVSLLQTKYHEKVKLVLIGRFDSFGRDDRAIYHRPRFETEFKQLCASLPWTIPPRFLAPKKAEKWTKIPLKNPVFVSLSTSPEEDFGVSLAQARAEGWPCVLSDWGGHRDVIGPHVLRIPESALGDPRTAEVLQSARAEVIAQMIHERKTEKKLHPKEKKTSSSVTEKFITKKDLVEITQRWRRSVGFPSDGNERRWINAAATFRGKIFYSSYRGIFGRGFTEGMTKISVLLMKSPEWSSMDEIFPAMEAAWACVPKFNFGTQVQFLRWTDTEILHNLSEISKSDYLVFEIAHTGALKTIRANAGFRGRIILHTHGDGTRYFSLPIDMDRLFTENDTFVCASQAEANSVRACFSNANVKVVPFSVEAAWPSLRSKNQKLGRKNLVYIGRISEQKNLHTLLSAFALIRNEAKALKRRPPILEIFGAEDHLGSPNMGMPSERYLASLRRLENKLGIRGFVRWHGFVSRKKIYQELSKRNWIFVSPSLHSDEDFGVAALSAIVFGNEAVLSAWGGHLDFAQSFRRSVSLVPVLKAGNGPVISPRDLARTVSEKLQKPGLSISEVSEVRRKIEKRYGLHAVAQALAEIIMEKPRKTVPLKSSPERLSIVSRQTPGSRKIFSGYDDPVAIKMFQAYGMQESKQRKPQRNASLFVCPWVELHRGNVIVRDPHRGYLEFSSDDANVRERWLVEMGLGFHS